MSHATDISYNEFMVITAQIESSQIITDYVEYIIRVSVSISSILNGRSWTISRRYSDFDALHKQINAYAPSGVLILPPKKIFGNLDRDFISSRQVALQTYLDVLLREPFLASSPLTSRFLSPPGMKFDFQEKALIFISMEFRGHNTWEVVQPCTEMGTRLRKTYILLRSCAPSIQDKYSLTLSEYGTDTMMESRLLSKALKSLTNIKHPYILPIQETSSNDRNVYLIQPFCEAGSLQDILNKTKPLNPATRKYGHHKQNATLTLEGIRTYSRQILEALHFIHEKEWPYGNLHLRNVILLKPGHCALTGLENSLLGHSPQHRTFHLQLKRPLSSEELDIYSFGRCLYEMVFSQSLKKATLDEDNLVCSTEIRSILESILTTESIKKGLPSVEVLLQKSFFQSVPTKLSEKPTWKIPRDIRETISELSSKLDQTLTTDIAQIRTARQRLNTQVRLEEERIQRKQSSRVRSRLSRANTIAGTGKSKGLASSEIESQGSDGSSPAASSKGSHRRRSTITMSTPKVSQSSAANRKPSTIIAVQINSDSTASTNSTSGVATGYESEQQSVQISADTSLTQNSARGDLLSSISSFNKSGLRKIKVGNDCSTPRF